ncbi:MAG: DUF3341 domain-containing protein [Flavobacteriales bacterium]|nr:DUF3341 domain-containing protein [Flavobacteriales bacterium]
MSNKEIHGVFGDEEVLLASAKALVAKGVRIRDVFSPFPIHGIDPVIGVPATRLHIAGFIYGICGFCLGLFMFWFTMIYDWPMNIGGKPNSNLFVNIPAFVPVLFELTVFAAAHGMVVTYFIRNNNYPGKKNWNPDLRTMDDKFLIQIDAENNGLSSEEIQSILKETGAEEITEKG